MCVLIIIVFLTKIPTPAVQFVFDSDMASVAPFPFFFRLPSPAPAEGAASRGRCMCSRRWTPLYSQLPETADARSPHDGQLFRFDGDQPTRRLSLREAPRAAYVGATDPRNTRLTILPCCGQK